jgi:DNA replication protein DnaC
MNQVLIEKVKQDLRTLRLKDMAEALEASLKKAYKEKQGTLQFIAELVQIQLEAVQKRSLELRINKAYFPPKMTFDNFDWSFQPGLNVEYLKDLQALGFIVNRQPLLILGKTGTGKTHIATSLGIKACEAGFRVRFYKLQELLAMLYATLADDTTDDIINKLTRLDLLIIDQLNYIRTKKEYPSLLLDLVSACHNRLALIVTTSISFEEWGDALGNPSITHAIVDRIFDHAGIINIRPGRSYRTEGPNAPKQYHPDKHTS